MPSLDGHNFKASPLFGLLLQRFALPFNPLLDGLHTLLDHGTFGMIEETHGLLCLGKIKVWGIVFIYLYLQFGSIQFQQFWACDLVDREFWEDKFGQLNWIGLNGNSKTKTDQE